MSAIPQKHPEKCSVQKDKKPFYRRRWVWIVISLLAILLITVGPWPVDSTPYHSQDFADTTSARMDLLSLEPTTGPMAVGMASLDITPPTGEPLAGFGGRSPMENTGVGRHVFVKAISISNGRRTVTIVGGDILLVMPELRDAILQRTALPREEVFFTASHTHSGPGGYSSRIVDQFVLGDFDQKILDRLADAFAKVIADSRANLQSAELDVALEQKPTNEADTAVRSRFDNSAAMSQVAVARFAHHGRPLAIFATFNAHATAFGKSNRKVDSDYPGLVQAGLTEATCAETLFAAGSVGSVKPVLSGNSEGTKTTQEWVARHVTARAIAAMQRQPIPDDMSICKWCLPGKPDSQAAEYSGNPSDNAEIVAAIVEVDLPTQQWRISDNWRLSPIAASYLHNRKTYIHVLRINDLVLLGMPGDYSSELSARLTSDLAHQRSRLVPVITSFNGDYIGYILPQNRYQAQSLESRWENLFGPWCGEYLHAISKCLLNRMEPGRKIER